MNNLHFLSIVVLFFQLSTLASAETLRLICVSDKQAVCPGVQVNVPGGYYFHKGETGYGEIILRYPHSQFVVIEPTDSIEYWRVDNHKGTTSKRVIVSKYPHSQSMVMEPMDSIALRNRDAIPEFTYTDIVRECTRASHDSYGPGKYKDRSYYHLSGDLAKITMCVDDRNLSEFVSCITGDRDLGDSLQHDALDNKWWVKMLDYPEMEADPSSYMLTKKGGKTYFNGILVPNGVKNVTYTSGFKLNYRDHQYLLFADSFNDIPTMVPQVIIHWERWFCPPNTPTHYKPRRFVVEVYHEGQHLYLCSSRRMYKKYMKLNGLNSSVSGIFNVKWWKGV